MGEEPKEIKKEKEKEKEKSGWEVKEVPASFTPAIINEKEEKVFDVNLALAEILNKIDKLMKLL